MNWKFWKRRKKFRGVGTAQLLGHHINILYDMVEKAFTISDEQIKQAFEDRLKQELTEKGLKHIRKLVDQKYVKEGGYAPIAQMLAINKAIDEATGTDSTVRREEEKMYMWRRDFGFGREDHATDQN